MELAGRRCVAEVPPGTLIAWVSHVADNRNGESRVTKSTIFDPIGVAMSDRVNVSPLRTTHYDSS